MIFHSPLWALGVAFLIILGAGLVMIRYSRRHPLSRLSQFLIWIGVLMALGVFLALVS